METEGDAGQCEIRLVRIFSSCVTTFSPMVQVKGAEDELQPDEAEGMYPQQEAGFMDRGGEFCSAHPYIPAGRFVPLTHLLCVSLLVRVGQK